MNTNNIEINTQSSIRLALKDIIYFNPFEINLPKHDADIIFITHGDISSCICITLIDYDTK